jgi:hypothetical protein
MARFANCVFGSNFRAEKLIYQGEISKQTVSYAGRAKLD